MSYPVFPSGSLYLPRILRLQPEIGGMFADHMDLFTLTRWRLTCKANYSQCSSALRRTLITLLRPFAPFPFTMINIVIKHRAIFGGEFALAFILRDPAYTPTDLEIYTTECEFPGICDAITSDPHIHDRMRGSNLTTSTIFVALRRLISQTLKIQLTNGKSIYIHQSYTTSAAAPISRYPCTALSNFVTAYGFGCSHPALTLQRRGLVADQYTPYLSGDELAIMSNLQKHGFSMVVSPAEWFEYRRPPVSRPILTFSATIDEEADAQSQDSEPMAAFGASGSVDDSSVMYTESPNRTHTLSDIALPLAETTTSSEVVEVTGDINRVPLDATSNLDSGADYDVGPSLPLVQTHDDVAAECWRYRFICPSQSRYFGDRGSFVDFFDPLDGDEARCIQSNLAPFGPMVVWRVMSTYECDEGCDVYDVVLEQGVTSIPVLFKKDPYAEIRYASAV